MQIGIYKKKAFVTALIFFILLFFVTGVIFYNRLKLHIISTLNHSLGTKVKIQNIHFVAPFFFAIKDIKIGAIFTAEKVKISSSLLSNFFKGYFVVSSIDIIHPIICIDINDVNEVTKLIRNLKFKGVAPLKARIYNGEFRIDKKEKLFLEITNIKGIVETPGFYINRSDIKFSFEGSVFNKRDRILSPIHLTGRINKDRDIIGRLVIVRLPLGTLDIFLKDYPSRVIHNADFDLEGKIEVKKELLKARCVVKGNNIALKKNPDKIINTPLTASFVILYNFKDRSFRIRSLGGDLIDLITAYD